MPLLVLNKNSFEPTDYAERKTAKAIIVNEKGEVFSFNSNLIGGGLEGGESYEDALHRESLEEAGIKIEIQQCIGEVIVYRDALKLKYIIKGYACKFLEKVAEPINELHHTPEWRNNEEFVKQVESDILRIEKEEKEGLIGDDLDYFDARISNRKAMVCFIKEAFKK